METKEKPLKLNKNGMLLCVNCYQGYGLNTCPNCGKCPAMKEKGGSQ